MEINKHKVFISYYHHDDECYKDEIIRWNEREGLFEDFSVNDGDIDDTVLGAEQIRRMIRDQYIKDATVLILLCGRNTKKRKYIDWELHAAMYDSEKNPKMGIVVINLPCSNNWLRAPTDEEKLIVSPSGGEWVCTKNREEYENRFPTAPSRIIDCLVNKNSDITFVDWGTIENDHYKLKELVEFAFQRRKTVEYDISAPLRKHNS